MIREAVKVRFSSVREMSKKLELEGLKVAKMRRQRRRGRRAYKYERKRKLYAKSLVRNVLEMEQPKRQRFIPASEAADNPIAQTIIELANHDFMSRTVLKDNTVIELEKNNVFMGKVHFTSKG